MSWTIDVKMHLESLGLNETIKENDITSSQEKAKVMIFLHRNLDDGLKCEYIIEKDHIASLKGLKKRKTSC